MQRLGKWRANRVELLQMLLLFYYFFLSLLMHFEFDFPRRFLGFSGFSSIFRLCTRNSRQRECAGNAAIFIHNLVSAERDFDEFSARFWFFFFLSNGRDDFFSLERCQAEKSVWLEWRKKSFSYENARACVCVCARVWRCSEERGCVCPFEGKWRPHTRSHKAFTERGLVRKIIFTHGSMISSNFHGKSCLRVDNRDGIFTKIHFFTLVDENFW